MLVRVGEAQAIAREGPALRIPTTPENLGEHNFMKGEAMGLRSLLKVPATVIESIDSQLKGVEDEPA